MKIHVKPQALTKQQKPNKEALLTRLRELDEEYRQKMQEYNNEYAFFDENARPPAPEKGQEHQDLEAWHTQLLMEEKTFDPDRFKLPEGWVRFNKKNREDRIGHFSKITNGRQPDCPTGTHFIYLYELNGVALECTFNGDYIKDLVALNYHHAQMEHDVKLYDDLISRWIPIEFFGNEFLDNGAYYGRIDKSKGSDLHDKIFGKLNTRLRLQGDSPLDALIREQPDQQPENNEFLYLVSEPYYNWKLYRRKFGFGGVVVSE